MIWTITYRGQRVQTRSGQEDEHLPTEMKPAIYAEVNSIHS